MRKRMLLLMACILAAAAAVAVANAQAVQTFDVTNNGATAYVVDGVANKALTLIRGKTYAFSLSVSGHPFDIKTVAGSGTGNQFNTGVSAQGQSTGTVTFNVPPNAPASLFYQCELHNQMSGAITTIDAVPTPATGPVSIAALCALLLGAGYLTLRKRTQEAKA
jgi:hypothetical protein